MTTSSERGFIPSGLAAGHFCEECGRLKMDRLWDVLTGCPACDEVITRHRCEKLPAAEEAGQAWQCPDCLAWWMIERKEDVCGECGQGVGTFTLRWKQASMPGKEAPRREPKGWQPYRDFVSRKSMQHSQEEG